MCHNVTFLNSFHRDLKTFFVLLEYTVHHRLCDYVLYTRKSTTDIDSDTDILLQNIKVENLF